MDARRAVLVAEMQHLHERGIDCGSCSGICCTAAANSMQIDVPQARTLLGHLRHEQLWTEELRQRLRACIERFGLDRPALGDGRRTFSRRTYTCPFYQGGPLGCSLPPAAKPFGCLAFNPRRPHQSEGGDCATTSNVQNVSGEAPRVLPIPVALLELSESELAQ